MNEACESELTKCAHVRISSVQSPYSASPLLNMSKIQSAQDLNVRALVTQNRKRECASTRLLFIDNQSQQTL